jgi:hypothetical protein
MSDWPFVDADYKIGDMLSSYSTSSAAHEIMELGDKNAPIPPADPERFAFFEKVLSR